jgi:hypothetical protein
MSCLRVAACLAVLLFSFSSMSMGADLTYSGVPGKWKRGARASKDKAPEAEAGPKEPGKEKGKRTLTGPRPPIPVAPATPEKQ